MLIYRLGSLGDTCIALPAFRVVRRRFPEARITLLTNLPVNIKAAPAPALLEGTGLIDDYLAYPAGTRSPWVLATIALELRRRRFDVVVNLAEWRGERSLKRDARFFRISGIARRVGFDPELAHKLRSDAHGQTEREAAWLLRRVAELGRADLNDRRWFDLDLSAAELDEADRVLADGAIAGPFIVFSLGTKASTNDWGRENWSALIAALGPACRGLGCVFVGSPDEKGRAAETMATWMGPKLNLCGRTGPRLSAAILARAILFVGHDSGPMHLAAAAGTPCIAIFSARNRPGQWFPLGEGHQVFYRHVPCLGCGLTECLVERKKCILDISVGEVAAAIIRRVTKITAYRTPAVGV